MTDATATVAINKIGASQRQLRCAIRMFFAGEDELSIHSLVAGAHRVAKDIFEHRGSDFYEHMSGAELASIAKGDQALLSQGSIEAFINENPEFVAFVRNSEDISLTDFFVKLDNSSKRRLHANDNLVANFLKHADRDPDAHLSIENLHTERVIYRAIASSLYVFPKFNEEFFAFSAFMKRYHGYDEILYSKNIEPYWKFFEELDKETAMRATAIWLLRENGLPPTRKAIDAIIAMKDQITSMFSLLTDQSDT